MKSTFSHLNQKKQSWEFYCLISEKNKFIHNQNSHTMFLAKVKTPHSWAQIKLDPPDNKPKQAKGRKREVSKFFE